MKKNIYNFVLRRELRDLLGVLVVFSTFCASVCADQKLGADWVETLLEQSKTLRNYRGGVVFEDSTRSLVVKSDSAHVRVEDAVFLFVNGVSYEDTLRTIKADTLAFFERKGLATFGGDVFLRSEARSIRADAVRFFYEQERLVATGGVELGLAQGRNLRASSIFYDLSLKQGSAIGNTKLHVSSKDRDTIFAQADSMTFSQGGKALLLEGSVAFRQGSTKSAARSASYSDSLIVLSGDPGLQWSDSSRPDTFSAQAELMHLRSDERVLSKLAFVDSTVIFSASGAGNNRNVSTIHADSAEIVFKKKKPHGLKAWGNVVLELVSPDSSQATMSGQVLKIAYADGRPDSLTFTGTCMGVYVAEESKEKSLLGGETAVLYFLDGQLDQMSLFDEAFCIRSEKNSEDMRVSGDYLKIWFEAGKVVTIQAEGAVKGHYHAQKETGP